MTTGSLISIREYLNTSYRPDCDYVDGVVEERNLGELDHGWVQGNLINVNSMKRSDCSSHNDVLFLFSSG